ncbi:uncharacterized protein [Miscanthus floridulus]|uniref:uncharacterized protein n=1 Tax=Miscanthus floridulus TaxID=154761 RepID=UPI003458871A
MKRQADKHCSERSFAIGDWVFLKIQPYVQSSLARRANQKLAFRFFGPYQILERIGQAAYKLALPSSSTIHPVFHVSQLKVSHGKLPVSADLPDDLTQFQVPQRILDRRWTPGDSPVEEVLVQWSQMPPSLATWETLEHLKQRFRRAPAWGHAGSKGGGIVNTAPAIHQDEPSTSEQARPVRERWPNARLSGPEWRT